MLGVGWEIEVLVDAGGKRGAQAFGVGHTALRGDDRVEGLGMGEKEVGFAGGGEASPAPVEPAELGGWWQVFQRGQFQFGGEFEGRSEHHRVGELDGMGGRRNQNRTMG